MSSSAAFLRICVERCLYNHLTAFRPHRLPPLLLWLLLVLPHLALPAPGMTQTGSFGPNVRVNHGGDGFHQDGPRVAVGPEGNIYVCWEEWRHISGSVYFTRSLDGGVTFETEYRVDPDGSREDGRPILVHWPCLAVDGLGIIFVAWVSWEQGQTGRVYCARSTDQGVSFGDAVLVSDSAISDRAWPAIAADPCGGVYLVWCDFRNGQDIVDLYTSRSNDGIIFTPNVKANLAAVGPTCTPPLPDIAAGDLPGLVHIVWRQTFGNVRWIYACRSLNWGQSFLPAVPVSHEPWVFGG